MAAAVGEAIAAYGDSFNQLANIQIMASCWARDDIISISNGPDHRSTNLAVHLSFDISGDIR